jgi:hypothetical protein
MKIAITEDTAYWIHNDQFFTARVQNDNVLKNTTRPVDTFNMPLKQVLSLMEIIDSLLEEDEELE